jgi:hypothetical protein
LTEERRKLKKFLILEENYIMRYDTFYCVLYYEMPAPWEQFSLGKDTNIGQQRELYQRCFSNDSYLSNIEKNQSVQIEFYYNFILQEAL